MSRPWRIEYEGALYHLLSRGIDGSDIFVDEKDRGGFLDAVGEMSERYDIDIFAYVLMDNHYHIIFKSEEHFNVGDYVRISGFDNQSIIAILDKDQRNTFVCEKCGQHNILR
jgi:REP element-mobilizing transposase RayT